MTLHPATADVLRFFKYDHLEEPLRSISERFAVLAHELVGTEEDAGVRELPVALAGPQLTNALTKLLEAKDCAVRAAIPPE